MNRLTKHISLILWLLPIITILPAHAQDTRQVGVDSVVVTFSDTPTHFSVQKAPLKYNKAFAMSFQEDDALSGIFNQVYPAFEGINNNPGMFYSDGCGNAISFKMSSAIYIFAANFTDLLNPDDPWHDNGKLTWTNLKTLYHHGWGIENHGLFDNPNVSSSAIIDYAFKRTQSYAAKKISDSILFKTFVIPNNVVTYVDYLTKNQYHSAVNQGQDNSWIGYGADGFDVESDTINWLKRVTLNRSFIQTGFKSTADALYADSKLGIHKWFLSGMHAVPGSFLQELFQIYQTYGQAGLDDILIAPDDEILDYLAVKQATQINTVQKNNKLKISFSGNIPTDRLQYALSLNITADKSISNIQVYGTNTFSFAGVGKDTALVNLSWQGRKFYTVSEMADSMTTLAVNNPSQYTGLVAMDYVQMLPAGQQKITLQKKLCGLDQSNWTLSYDDFFCNPINLGNDTSLCEGNGISLKGPDGMQSYEWKKSDNNTILGTSQNIELFPEQSETVLLKVTSKHGNIASDSIHVNLLSCPVVSLGNDTSMQIGDSLILRAPTGTGYQYNWNTGDTTSSLTCKSTQPDTLSYSVQVVNANHCQSEDTIRVITYKLLDVPVVVAVYDTIKINQGAGVTVQAETYLGTTFVWRHDSISDTTTVGEYTFYPDKSVKVYVKACNTDGCSEKDSTYVEVMTQPVPTGFLKSDTSFCAGSCIVLNGPDNVQSYEWRNKDNNTYVSSDQYIQVCPKKSETLSLKIVTLTGDTAVDSIHLNLLPTPNVNLGNDTTITIDDSLILLAPTGTGYQYLWNNGDTTQSIVCSSFSPDTLTYSVQVTNSYQCQDRDTIKVIIFDSLSIPTVTTSYDSITIIRGEKATLKAETDIGKTFIWRYDTISDTTNIGSFTFSPDKSVMVYVKTCNTFGCSLEDSTYVEVMTQPVPTGFLKSDTSFCAGSCIVLNGPDNMQSYEWQNKDNNTYVSSDQYIQVCPKKSETLSLKIVTLAGDTTVDSIHLNLLPTPNVNLGNDTTITIGDSLTLLAPTGTGYQYLWNNGDTTQSVVCSSSVPDTLIYSVEVNNSFGCTDEDTIRVFTYDFNRIPIVSTTYDTIEINPGDSAKIEATTDVGNMFAWKYKTTVDVTEKGSFTFSPAKSVMVYVKACNDFGCSEYDSTYVWVFTGLTDFLKSDTSFCAGSCIVLKGPDNMQSYNWRTTDDNTFLSSDQYIEVCPANSETVSLQIITLQGDTATDSIHLNVLPSPTVNLGNDTSITVNDSLILKAPVGNGYSYLWNTGETAQSIVCHSSTPDTLFYSVNVSNSYGCQDEDTIRVITYKPLGKPLVFATFDTLTIALGDSATVKAKTDDGTIFAWRHNQSVDITSNGNFTFYPEKSLMVYVKACNVAGCSKEDSTFVKVVPVPPDFMRNDTTICAGSCLTIYGPNNMKSYKWETSYTDTIISEQDSLIVCPEQSTTYFLSIVDKANRLLKDSVRISTQAAPDAQIQYTSKRACINSTITLSATDGYHYQWLPSGDTTQSIQYLVSDTSKVYLKVTNDLGCTNSDSLTIYALPMPKMSISGLLPSYCSNDQSVVLTGKPNGGEFSGPGINGNVFFPNLAGPGLHTLYYTVSNEGQCTASDSASTFIYGPIPKINLHPADTTLLDGGMVTYDAGSGFNDYYWTTGDTTQIVHVFYSDFPNGTDTITVIGLAGACTSVGSAVIHFGEPTGLSEFYDNNILVFPNPNKGIFSINWPASNEKIIFSLTDITGHLIMQKEIPRGESQLKLALPGLKQGLYLIHFQSERGFWIKKVMIR